MNVIGKSLSNQELLNIKGGCDIDCYCGTLWNLMICGGNIDFVPSWSDHNCPTGNLGDLGYPGSGDYECESLEL